MTFWVLLLSKSQFGRKLIGGRWIRRREPGFVWIRYEGSILEDRIPWASFDGYKYELEDWI